MVTVEMAKGTDFIKKGKKMNNINLGFQLMAYGLFGILTVCTVFILLIRGIVKFFPHKPE